MIKIIKTSMMKCAHGHNYHGEREVMMNEDITNQECLRCDEIESLDHVIKCKNIGNVRVECVKDLTI